MYQAKIDGLLLFDKRQAAPPNYKAFAEKLPKQFPSTTMKVQKTQTTRSNRQIYARVSFARVKKKAEPPQAYLVVPWGKPRL